MTAARRGGRARRFLRVFSGLLAGGMVVLVLALGAAWVIAAREQAPGPGTATVGWHVVAAVGAVAAQVVADRRDGPRGVAASLVVVAIAVALLVGLWIA